MKINVLFYGTCQADAILQILNLSDDYNASWISCKKTDLDKESFIKKISESDIIITQSIKDNFRDVDYLSTSYIIKHKKPNCKVIIFDTCHFDFYHFDTLHDREFINSINYHYTSMVECFKNGYSIDYYINNFVNNIDLKTSEELESIAQIGLKELYRRYKRSKQLYEQNNVYPVTMYKYLKQNYKDKLLFHTKNHPSKYILHNICEQIIQILQIPNTLNYDADPLSQPKSIIYKCISNNVNFDISIHHPLMKGKTEIYEIIEMYYDVYRKYGFPKV